MLGHLKSVGQREHGVDDHRRLAVHGHTQGPNLFGEPVPRRQPFASAELRVFHPNHQHVPFCPEGLQEARMRQFSRVVLGKDAAVLVLHLQVGNLQSHEHRQGGQRQDGWEPMANQNGGET